MMIQSPTPHGEPLFSIFIPTWNNLPFLKICVESIRKNSTFRHQIIVHVNDGSDGTLDYVRREGLDYTHSEQNIGVCLAMNSMRPKVKTEYILFLNDDMYVLPGWDKVLWDEISRLPDNRFFLSSTTIQPHTAMAMGILADYGDSPETFREADLLRDYAQFPLQDWMGATLPPNIVHRDIWDLVGGYSVEFSPGMYSDPDFTAKLWLCGIRYMKGLSASRIYHFETKSTTRIRKNDGRLQFLLKWGISSSSLRKIFTWRGHAFSPEKLGTYNASRLRTALISGRLRALWCLTHRDFGPLWKFWK
jgi:glycosyltransferase involved in cell wall biosynthesis